jgi:hypothetical protein
MKKIALFASINRRLYRCNKIKKDMKKYYLFFSHSELGDTGEKQGFGQKNLLLLITS